MTYDPDAFADLRHIGPSTTEMAEMLAQIGADSLDALIAATVPANLRQSAPLSWPALSEQALLARMRQVAGRNRVMHSLIGQGYYGTFTPPAIRRYIFENPAWYTAYTPYQPEISQGRLEALLNFQTVVCDMTGLDVANASLLDEASAAAEAMAMAQRVAGSKAKAFFVDAACHPQTIAVLRTRASGLDIQLVIGPPADLKPEKVFGAIFQYPDTYGEIRDPAPMIAALHAHQAIAVVATDLLALTLLRAPAALGADIAIGSAQRFGVPMGYGGPHAAFMAVKDDYKRQMPGRIVGVSRDSHGNPAYRLSLQTREQHIRREKATSNICTAQALLAVMAGMYAVFYGPDGLKAIASRLHARTHLLAKALQAAGFTVENTHYFDTLTLHVGPRQEALIARAVAADINLRRIGADRLGIALDETVTDALLESLAGVFGASLTPATGDGLPPNLRRDSAYLTHPVFHMNRAEAGMMRYMRKLADRDLALDRAMIPLGSCTMKLNSAASMTALTWPEFANIHPFAPKDQATGYAEAIEDLSQKLCEITGYDAFSMQPNSGAQGEFAGLMTIRAYHLANGDDQRSICLIPVSAHGTNPASAQMAGMDVVVVKTMANGDIDLNDLRAKAEAAGNCLAAVMITYPSTHGVFEETLREICAITHIHGGQVYLDGANMNAMVGLVKPGEVGADVSHLNLHKTFAIPHGGGGPGMGPIGVKAHLAPFLPRDPASGLEGAVAAAPYGSASILLISWAYCLMMGGAGLTKATKVAILNANYLASRLSQDYEILYRGKTGHVAHECILDPRPFAALGVTVEDIAKRLIDHGFHAPTMSWPVSGTLMIEPTESEPKAELDRFIRAMSAIRAEIAEIAAGEIAIDSAALRHAPHTLADLIGPWDRPYDRAAAVLPAGADIGAKYWPPVGRIDNVFGDRNLMCTCPPLSDYEVA